MYGKGVAMIGQAANMAMQFVREGRAFPDGVPGELLMKIERAERVMWNPKTSRHRFGVWEAECDRAYARLIEIGYCPADPE